MELEELIARLQKLADKNPKVKIFSVEIKHWTSGDAVLEFA